VASIDGVTFPLLLDTGGEVSVLPMDLFRRLNRLLENAGVSRTVATFGNGAVQLFGPVQLRITLCGVCLVHPFYLVDDKAASLSPALDGIYIALFTDRPGALTTSDVCSTKYFSFEAALEKTSVTDMMEMVWKKCWTLV